VFLLLSPPGLAGAAGAAAVEDAFRYADEGEACALYRSLAHLPGPERFLGRAREGCRSNMRSVFEASACDTPYLERHFDDVAWRQALVKCVFIGAPLARIPGVERRRDEELARMALDLADERRSAGRPVPPELWLLVGPHGGARALESLRQELGSPHAAGREAAARALERRGPPTSGS
jgi:hypothetical protein